MATHTEPGATSSGASAAEMADLAQALDILYTAPRLTPQARATLRHTVEERAAQGLAALPLHHTGRRHRLAPLGGRAVTAPATKPRSRQAGRLLVGFYTLTVLVSLLLVLRVLPRASSTSPTATGRAGAPATTVVAGVSAQAEALCRAGLRQEGLALTILSQVEGQDATTNPDQITPGSPNAARNRRGFTQALASLDQAISLFRQAIRLQPARPLYALYLANKALLEKAQIDDHMRRPAARAADLLEAERGLLRAWVLQPRVASNAANLGRLYVVWAAWEPARWPRAITWFDRAVQLSPRDGLLLDEAGAELRAYGQYLATATGQRQPAVALYTRAVRLFAAAAQAAPQRADAFVLWGDTEALPLYLDNPGAAIAPYEQALRLRLAPEMRVGIVTTLADACVQVNAFAKAVRYAQEGLRLRPGDPQLTRILAAATRGRR